jgi:LAO/AO transport system kinase
MAATYRERGETVGVIAIDPSSPFTGGAVLGDRIRMASTVGDMEVFVRSMSARGSLGGLSTATTDAVKALDAFGKDKIIIETVGAGQNEIEIVKTADTVAVLVPPGAGDDIQMLKAGILEIADIFVVNKADKEGSDRTVMELRETIEMRESPPLSGHGGPETASGDAAADGSEWEPVIVETVATTGEGIETFLETVAEHVAWLAESGELEAQARRRHEAEIKTLLREDVASLVEAELVASGGLESHVDRVLDHETDPYAVAEELLGPIEECVDALDSRR